MDDRRLARCWESGGRDEAVLQSHDPGSMNGPWCVLGAGHQQFPTPSSVESPPGGEVVIEVGEFACEILLPDLDLDLRSDRARVRPPTLCRQAHGLTTASNLHL
jgi:hypothetical protein